MTGRYDLSKLIRKKVSLTDEPVILVETMQKNIEKSKIKGFCSSSLIFRKFINKLDLIILILL
tara:strand:+ start:46 stop:234 length:189 start_codon:yes stop_codon:yes gene_type:complete